MRLAYRAGVFVWLVGLSGGRFDWGRFLGAQLAGAGVAYQLVLLAGWCFRGVFERLAGMVFYLVLLAGCWCCVGVFLFGAIRGWFFVPSYGLCRVCARGAFCGVVRIGRDVAVLGRGWA